MAIRIDINININIGTAGKAILQRDDSQAAAEGNRLAPRRMVSGCWPIHGYWN